MICPSSTAWFLTTATRRCWFRCSSSRLDSIGVGIDLGTTNSAVAVLVDGIPQMVPVQNGRTIPSVVAITSDHKVLVGRDALDSDSDSERFVYRHVKRIIGTGGKLPHSILQVVPHIKPNSQGKTYRKDSLANQVSDAAEFPTLLKGNSNTNISPELISCYILKTLIEAAEQYTGQAVTRAVIGVPAYFHDAQQEATQRAAEMAGLKMVKLLREPEAAALSYNNHRLSSQAEELVLVFDLGGGTFDVSMLLVSDGMTEIISTSGNVQLGGANFDLKIAQHWYKRLQSHGVATKEWPETAKDAVLRAAEVVRIYLSNHRVAKIALPLDSERWIAMNDDTSSVLWSDNDQSSNATLVCEFTRKEMEQLCHEEFQALLRPIREVAIMSGALLPGDTSPTLVEAAMEMEGEDRVMLEEFYDDGGSEQLQHKEESNVHLAKRLQQKGRKRSRDLAKQERVFRSEKRKIGRPSLESGTKVMSGITGRPISRVVLVGGATRMPAVGRLIAALTGSVPQKTVNPDEAVALGCAVHVGILDGSVGNVVLNPMQIAILRAVAEQNGFASLDDDFQS